MSEEERQRALELARRKLYDRTEPLQASEPQLARALLATDALLTASQEEARLLKERLGRIAGRAALQKRDG